MSHRIRSTAIAVVAIAATALLGNACSDDRAATSSKPGVAGSSPAAASTKGLDIAFHTLASPTSGENKVEAVVKQDGKPVTDADVSVTFRMPAMPSMNMPEMHSTTALAHQGDGRYVGTGQLEMAGSWNVTVNVSRNGMQLGNARFSLLAK
jgi:hypothetical protein